MFLTALFGLQIADADTLPGVPGSPSPQVITVQGCSTCIGTGASGGGSVANPYGTGYSQAAQFNSFSGAGGINISGAFDPFFTGPTGTTVPLGQPGAMLVTGPGVNGSFPISGTSALSLPYSGVGSNSYGQTGVLNSGFLNLGYDAATGLVDALTVAPFGGNGAGNGYPASYNQPGVLVVQGGLQGGALGIQGNLNGPFVLPTAAPTPQPIPSSGSFMGVGGDDYTSAGNFNALKVNSAGAASVTGTLNVTPVVLSSSAPMSAVGTANGVVIPVNGQSMLTFNVTGSPTGTVQVGVSSDNGATAYIATSQLGIRCVGSSVGNSAGQSWYQQVLTASNISDVVCPISGFNSVVVYFSGYTSGTGTVNWSLGPAGTPLTPTPANKTFTSSSATTTCTTIKSTAGMLHALYAIVPQTGIISFFDSGSASCTAADMIFSGTATNFPTPGTAAILDIPFVSGLSYELTTGSWVGTTFASCAASCPAAQALYY